MIPTIPCNNLLLLRPRRQRVRCASLWLGREMSRRRGRGWKLWLLLALWLVVAMVAAAHPIAHHHQQQPRRVRGERTRRTRSRRLFERLVDDMGQPKTPTGQVFKQKVLPPPTRVPRTKHPTMAPTTARPTTVEPTTEEPTIYPTVTASTRSPSQQESTVPPTTVSIETDLLTTAAPTTTSSSSSVPAKLEPVALRNFTLSLITVTSLENYTLAIEKGMELYLRTGIVLNRSVGVVDLTLLNFSYHRPVSFVSFGGVIQLQVAPQNVTIVYLEEEALLSQTASVEYVLRNALDMAVTVQSITYQDDDTVQDDNGGGEGQTPVVNKNSTAVSSDPTAANAPPPPSTPPAASSNKIYMASAISIAALVITTAIVYQRYRWVHGQSSKQAAVAQS